VQLRRILERYMACIEAATDLPARPPPPMILNVCDIVDAFGLHLDGSLSDFGCVRKSFRLLRNIIFVYEHNPVGWPDRFGCFENATFVVVSNVN
jgi:hypothetical protein